MLDNFIQITTSILTIYVISQYFTIFHGWFFYSFLPKINHESRNYFYDSKLAKKELIKNGLLSILCVFLLRYTNLPGLTTICIAVVIYQFYQFNKIVKYVERIYTMK